jgi:hypothetical protein
MQFSKKIGTGANYLEKFRRLVRIHRYLFASPLTVSDRFLELNVDPNQGHRERQQCQCSRKSKKLST